MTIFTIHGKLTKNINGRKLYIYTTDIVTFEELFDNILYEQQ